MAPNYAKEPWKHLEVWRSHMVKKTCAYSRGVSITVATCECGWSVSTKATGAGYVAQDDAIHDHWLSVVAEAESVPA